MVPTNLPETPSTGLLSPYRTPPRRGYPRSPLTSPATGSSGSSGAQVQAFLNHYRFPMVGRFARFEHGSPDAGQPRPTLGLGPAIELRPEPATARRLLFRSTPASVSSANVTAQVGSWEQPEQDVFGDVVHIPQVQQRAQLVGLGLGMPVVTAQPQILRPETSQRAGGAAPSGRNFQRAYLSREALPEHPSDRELRRCYAEPEGDAYSDIEDEGERSRAFDRTNPSERPSPQEQTQSSPKLINQR